MNTFLYASLVLAAVLPLQSQAPPAPPAQSATPAAPAPAPATSPAELPKPAPELDKLSFLVGDWVHAENYYPGPTGPGGKGGGRSKAAWVLGNQHLLVSYVSKAPMGQIEGRGILNWDPQAKAYRMYWFDNTGASTVYSGTFNAEGALVLSADSASGAGPAKQQFTIRKQEDGKVLFTHQIGAGSEPLKTAFESLASPDVKK
jgi:hypothetical protein